MAKKRLFVAINFPEEIKEEIYQWQREHWDLPVRWTPKENLHLTLQFLGWVSEEYVDELQRVLREVAGRHAPFIFSLRDITYGPLDGRAERALHHAERGGPPRMIWLNGEVSDELAALVEDIRKTLERLPFAQELHREDRPFRTHITLARFKAEEWRRKIYPEQRRRIGRKLPEIETAFAREIPVEHFELMESHLSRPGPTYASISSFNLGLPGKP